MKKTLDMLYSEPAAYEAGICDKFASYAQCRTPEAERLWAASEAEKQKRKGA